MTFQTPQNDEENRGETSKTDLNEEIHSTWLELVEEFQTLESDVQLEANEKIYNLLNKD